MCSKAYLLSQIFNECVYLENAYRIGNIIFIAPVQRLHYSRVTMPQVRTAKSYQINANKALPLQQNVLFT